MRGAYAEVETVRVENHGVTTDRFVRTVTLGYQSHH